MKNLPNFFILGAAKCGTSSLYYFLQQHPNICMSRPKEPYFFEAEYDRGLEYYTRTYFDHWTSEQRIGDARQRNLFLPWVPERIKKSIKDPRFIVLVRNPIERIASHWWFNYCRGVEKDRFSDAVMKDIDRMERKVFFTPESYAKNLVRNTGISTYVGYVESGYYSDQISRYDDLFGKDSTMVILSDDLKNNKKATLKLILNFLEVEEWRFSNLINKNPSLPKNISYIMNKYRYVKVKSKKLFGYDEIKSTATGNDLLEDLIQSAFGGFKPKFDGDTLSYLAQHYGHHNEKLAVRIGKNLDHWNMEPRYLIK